MEQELLEQHKMIYFGAIKEIIRNNNRSLVEDDLLPLFQAPPLETMDTLKQKLLSLAKGAKLLLNSDQVTKILGEYRLKLQEECKKIGQYRESEILIKLEQIKKQKEEITFKMLKKDFISLDKNIKKQVKKTMLEASSFILSNLNLLFNEDVPEKLALDISKFLKSTYPKQMLENIDMKVLVKDTTLMNGIKEQTERFLFTKENSHLFD